MRRTPTRSLLLAGIAFTLISAACARGTQTPSATPAEAATKGGTLVIAAEQEPDCLDVIGSCAGASWGYWTGMANTIPRAFDVIRGGYKPSVLLTGEPKLDESPKQKVTYSIAKDAVWSDGQPITSADFKFTWQQIVNGKDIYSTSGYDKIEAIDDSEPNTAVVTFKENYAPWRDLFSAFYGVLPKHLLDGKDRNAEMKDGFTWSGGPFMIETWTKGQEMVLVPNEKFWGKKPNVDKVVFRFITDSTAELQAYKTGQVMAMYPQPQIELAQQLASLPDTKYTIEAGLTLEGLWFQTQKFPIDDVKVRQAIAYAVDRKAVLSQLITPIQKDAVVLQAFNAKSTQGGKFFTPAYEKYAHDLKKVDELMTSAGWKKGADGIWEKGGKKADLEINTTAGNKGRELVEQLLQSQLKEAGFNLKIENTKAGTLFGQWLPEGRMFIGMYAQVLTPDPDMCVIFCSSQVPGPANNNAGQNFQFFKDPAVDKPWEAQLKELDVDKRAKLVRDGHEALAEAVPAIPLYQKPQALVWSTKLGGPIEDNSTLGPFYNMAEWYIKQ